MRLSAPPGFVIRGLAGFWLIAMGALALSASASAQNYPERVVTMVVPVSAGGGTDAVARSVAQGLSDVWGKQVIIENRPGAGSLVGTEYVAKAPPDGYTLLFTESSSFVINPHVYAKARYDALNDFEPIALVVRLAPTLVVGNDVPARSMAEFIAYAKAHPGELTYASPGIGSYTHIGFELLKRMAGIDILHVPYKGSAQVMPDLLAGRVGAYMVTYSVFDPYVRAGQLRVLGLATDKRIAALPDIATIHETVPGYSIDVWFGMAAPKGTPAPILDKIHADVTTFLASRDFVEKIIKPQGFTAGNLSRQEFVAKIASDYGKWAEAVKIADVKID